MRPGGDPHHQVRVAVGAGFAAGEGAEKGYAGDAAGAFRLVGLQGRQRLVATKPSLPQGLIASRKRLLSGDDQRLQALTNGFEHEGWSDIVVFVTVDVA